MNFKTLREFEDFLKRSSWQSFEGVVGSIFESHDFEAEVSVVKIFEKTKRQYDVLAKKYDLFIGVDCKKWKRSSESAIKKAVEKQSERCSRIRAKPMIVTLLDEDIISIKGVPVVPVFKLNDFLMSQVYY